MNKPDKAEEYALQSVYIDPYDLTAHELLAAAYEKTNNAAGLEREKRVIKELQDLAAKRKTNDAPAGPPPRES
jgi:hypothetical protein